MQVFLFNHSDRTLLGPLSAISPGGMYIDKKAWARPGHKSTWPAQVNLLHMCFQHPYILAFMALSVRWAPFVTISPGPPHEIEHARVSTRHAHALTSCNKHVWLVRWGCFAHEQVKVAVHHPIIALQEKVFRPLIEPAYYSAKEFHFDLTAPEALSLLETFTHRQVRPHHT